MKLFSVKFYKCRGLWKTQPIGLLENSIQFTTFLQKNKYTSFMIKNFGLTCNYLAHHSKLVFIINLYEDPFIGHIYNLYEIYKTMKEAENNLSWLSPDIGHLFPGKRSRRLRAHYVSSKKNIGLRIIFSNKSIFEFIPYIIYSIQIIIIFNIIYYYKKIKPETDILGHIG